MNNKLASLKVKTYKYNNIKIHRACIVESRRNALFNSAGLDLTGLTSPIDKIQVGQFPRRALGNGKEEREN